MTNTVFTYDNTKNCWHEGQNERRNKESSGRCTWDIFLFLTRSPNPKATENLTESGLSFPNYAKHFKYTIMQILKNVCDLTNTILTFTLYDV